MAFREIEAPFILRCDKETAHLDEAVASVRAIGVAAGDIKRVRHSIPHINASLTIAGCICTSE
jgi:hypothetical protein